MSDTAKAKAATVAAKIAGQAATIAAHGVPVGPLVEEVVNGLLGELLDIQDEQLAMLRNIERDVAQLVEEPYRNAREMLEKAMIPGRPVDAVKADLRRASDEFLRAAQYRDATQSQASAYMDASLVLGLLGDLPAMRHYGDKAWKAGVAALLRESDDTTRLLTHSYKNRAKRLAGFWSLRKKDEYRGDFWLLEWGGPGAPLAGKFPEARAIDRLTQSRDQVAVYRDIAATFSEGPDVLPHYWTRAVLQDAGVIVEWSPMTSVDLLYHPEQVESRRHELASLVTKLGIDAHLYGAWYPWLRGGKLIGGIYFDPFRSDDPKQDRFGEEVKRIFPYGVSMWGWGTRVDVPPLLLA
jgi:hypothetical protein